MRKTKTAMWMASAFAVALIIAVIVLANATAERRMGMALRDTARWSFVLFCLATCGGALTTLFGSAFLGLARAGRDLGLAFAAAHVVHVALAYWLLYHQPDPFPRLPLIVFDLGVFWTYLVATMSLSETVIRWLGPKSWKILRTIGIEYIAFAYAFEFGGRILSGNRTNTMHYLPLFAVAVGGPLLRIGAFAKRRLYVANATGTVPG